MNDPTTQKNHQSVLDVRDAAFVLVVNFDGATNLYSKIDRQTVIQYLRMAADQFEANSREATS